MIWTRINPDDPKTYPKTYDTVVFEGRWLDARVRCVGYWSGKSWLVLQGGELPPERVPRWSAIPALPGEEAEAKAEHTASPDKIAIVRAWLGEDNPWEHVDRLLARLEAIPRHAAPTPDWHDRPTSPGWWLWDANEAFMDWLHLDESQCCNPKYQVGNWYGPVVVPEQEKKL